MPASASGWVRAVESLARTVASLGDSVDRAEPRAAAARGYWRPDEEERLIAWFARFLTAREALWQVLGEVRAALPGDLERASGADEWRALVAGYAAACLIVRLDRLLVEELATDALLQRKLNEGSREHRIPRKQFTAVYESLAEPRKALALLRAMRFIERHRGRVEALAHDPLAGGLVRALPALEAALDRDKRRYLDLLLAFGRHALRRRGASARQRATFAVLEAGGRLVSEVRAPQPPCLADPDLRARLAALLEPGDVLITRHERALTNLFLPGFWPHAALYVGSAQDRARLGVELDPERAARWSGDRCVLEALKDGVLFRPLAETLSVDAVAVLRPRLSQGELALGLARAARHEGKPYNFDFDFLRSDRLVCTEVVYRAFDGLGGLAFELRERAGRPTLSAEDLLDLALAGEHLVPVAVCGAPPHGDALLVGAPAAAALAASYRTRVN